MEIKGMDLITTNKNYDLMIFDESLNHIDYAVISFKVLIKSTKRENYPIFKDVNHIIDYGYPANVWCKFKYNFKIERDILNSFIRISVENEDSIPFEIKDIKIEESKKDEPLLGGVKLYQLEGLSLMMAYVIKTPDDKLVVIDGGYPHDEPNLMSFIKEHDNRVDHWFLTHFHEDHITALVEAINKEDIIIDNLYYNLPTPEEIKSLSDDKDFYAVEQLIDAIKNNGHKIKNIIKVKKYGEYKVSDFLFFRCLNDPWIERNGNFGNNSGVMYTMHTKGETVLFLGDMGDRGDYYLKDEWVFNEVSNSKIIQMAHHGQNGVTDYFYDSIKDMKVCLYPAAKWIYDNRGDKNFNEFILKSFHTRDYVREREVMRIYVLKDGRALIE